MSDGTSSPWQPNYTPSDDHDQSSITIKLWEYFSSAAAGVCQLYKSKLDQCADFQCLMDALSPMDQFFHGSQLSIDAAAQNGRLMGSRCVRLQLRDLSYTSSRTEETTNGLELVVPLNVLLAHELGRNICSSVHVLGKRKRSSSRRCRHKQKRIHYRGSPESPIFSRFSAPDEGLRVDSLRGSESSSTLMDTSFSAKSEGFLSSNNLSSNLSALILHQPELRNQKLAGLADPPSLTPSTRRRPYDFLTQCSPPLRECLLSCETDRHRASLDPNAFELFQDAVHMTNLLDPLSKFSVTGEREDVEEITPKRPRTTCPTIDEQRANTASPSVLP